MTDRNRSRPPASEKAPVVKVYFELSKDDKDAIADIPMDQVPSSITLARTADDSTTPTLTPFPRHPRKPFTEAADRLIQSLTRLAGQFEQATDSEYQDPNDWAATLGKALQNPDTPWTDANRGVRPPLRVAQRGPRGTQDSTRRTSRSPPRHRQGACDPTPRSRTGVDSSPCADALIRSVRR